MSTAIVKACFASNSIANTGKECDIAMGPLAMLMAVPPSLRFTDTDLEAPMDWLTPLLHAAAGSRIYPFFGLRAPIRMIENATDSDVIETMDDGLKVFVRYGIYNINLSTTSGGLCYANKLQSLLNSGYALLQIDNVGRMLVHKYGENEDGVNEYGGIITDFMYAPAPTLADFKSVYKNRFSYSFSPVELVKFGEVLENADVFLDQMGLIDAKIVGTSGNVVTTYLEIQVKSECAESDLVTLFLDKWNFNTLFSINNKETGANVAITAVTRNGDKLRLACTVVDGVTYVVSGTTAAALLVKDISGYEITQSADITVEVP